MQMTVPESNIESISTSTEETDKEVDEMIKVSFFPEETEYREGDSYFFRVTVQNQSIKKVFPFQVYNDPFYQFSFNIRKGYQEHSTKKFNYYRFLYDQGNFSDSHKTMTLDYRESYSRLIDLDNFFQFDRPGLYEVTGYFYPLGIHKSDYKIPIQPFVFRIHSRQPMLSGFSDREVIHPSVMDSDKSVEQFKQIETDQSYNGWKRRQLTPLFPDEVVKDHFQRIRVRDYSGYLNNLELERLLVSSYRFTENYFRYQGAETYEKKIIIEDFKKFLIEKIDYVLIDSLVLKTTVVDNSAVVEAVVAVRESFEKYRVEADPQTGESIPVWLTEPISGLERYYYLTFDLEIISELKNKPWKIVGYVARSLPVEQYWGYKNRSIDLEKLVVTDSTQPKGKSNTNDSLSRMIHFEHNRFEVKGRNISKVEKLAQFLIAYPDLQIELYGHTDEVGDEDYNYELSKKRVESVASMLLAAGVDLGRMRFFYRGESEPLIIARTDEERRLNRRVEIKVINPSL